jgi:hypothetical protein
MKNDPVYTDEIKITVDISTVISAKRGAQKIGLK